MALNVKYFFISLLFGSILAAILLKPFETVKFKKENIPQLKFVSFESFEITKKGVEYVGFGREAFKYKKKLTIKFPKFMIQTHKGVETISANNGVIVEDSYIRLYDLAELHRDDNLTIKSSKMLYDMKTKLYSTEGNKFEAYYGKNVVIGQALKYYQKSGKIFADRIQAKIFEEDR
ncbi:MAG TPA: hypothetical protein EYG74_07650 [Sulfurimonas autotrophica]|nr:hypothetical protein [Sulfurimonas autotrophica]